MHKWAVGWTLGMLLAVVWASQPQALAQKSALSGQDARFEEVEQLLRKSGQLALRGKLDEAVAALQLAQEKMHTLAGRKDRRSRVAFRRLEARLRLVRRVLKRKGASLPPVPDFSKPPQATPSQPPVSFVKQVAPILVRRCRNCHINQSRGRFSMATFESLMRGVGGAAVINPGSASTSRLMEVLSRGEMPPNGPRVPQEQVELVARWIDQGARFDGPNPSAPLLSLVPGTTSAQRLQVVRATGQEKVSFTRDIAPVVVKQCVSCHGSQRPRARLGLDTFARLLRGSPNGPILTPGKPRQSLLIAKLRGTAEGQRMPAGKPPLPEKTIQLFETWIAEGARFDGPDPNMPLQTLVQIYEAQHASHEQLAQRRKQLAQHNWRLGNPGLQARWLESENFLVAGNLPREQLQHILQMAETQAQKVAQMLRLSRKSPRIRGRMTLFVFQRRFQYSEFVRMVERRELPRGQRAHWRWTIVDAYGCLFPPGEEDEELLRGLITELVAGVMISAQGDVPRWFAQGVALAAVERLVRRDPRIAQWEQLLPEALAACSSPQDLIQGRMALEHAQVLRKGFAGALVRHRGFSTLLGQLQKGQQFAAAFARAYRASPEQMAALWIRSANR